MTPPPSPSLEEQNKIANKMKMKKVAGAIVSLIALAGIMASSLEFSEENLKSPLSVRSSGTGRTRSRALEKVEYGSLSRGSKPFLLFRQKFPISQTKTEAANISLQDFSSSCFTPALYEGSSKSLVFFD